VAVIGNICDSFQAGDISSDVADMSREIHWNEADDFPYADRNVAKVIGQA
jgi:hypothetical protein